MKKIYIIIFIILNIIFTFYQVKATYENPGSSKGFADFDEEAAEEKNKELINQEQNNEKIKSTNNYLDSLEVKNYNLSPSFDKQILEYTIDSNVKDEEIIIEAIPADAKSSVNGTGKIKLNEGKNYCRIDVTAESGTVRTYIINIEKINNDIEENENREDLEVSANIKIDNEIENVENTPIINENSEKTEKDNKIQLKILTIFIVAAILIIFIYTKKKK